MTVRFVVGQIYSALSDFALKIQEYDSNNVVTFMAVEQTNEN